MRILALDTATEVCSVALLLQSPGEASQLLVRELPPGPGHSAHILSLVQAVLSEAALSLRQLDCIAAEIVRRGDAASVCRAIRQIVPPRSDSGSDGGIPDDCLP